MKIRNLEIKVIAPILLWIPMACMHLGDRHHSGDHHPLVHQPSYPYSTYERATSNPSESFVMLQNIMMAQEGTESQPEGEKGG